MTPTDQLKAIADDYRAAAKFYEKTPGLAESGVNGGTIIEIYYRIAKAIDGVVAALSFQEKQDAT